MIARLVFFFIFSLALTSPALSQSPSHDHSSVSPESSERQTSEAFWASMPEQDPSYIFGQLGPTTARWAELARRTMIAQLEPVMVRSRALLEKEFAQDPGLRHRIDATSRALINLPWSTASSMHLSALIERLRDRLGLGVDTRFALYGLGLMPLFQIEIAETDRLEARLSELDDAVGHQFSAYPVDPARPELGGKWWRAARGRAVLMVSLSHGVLRIFLCHQSLEQSLLPQFLEPLRLSQKERMSRAARWRARIKGEEESFGMKAQRLSGWLSLSGLIDQLLRGQVAGGDAGSLLGGCQAVIRAIQHGVPRLSFAHVENPAGLWLSFFLHTSAQIQESLNGLSLTASPPLTITGDAALELNLSMRGAGLLQLINRFADAVQPLSATCPLLAGLSRWASQSPRLPAAYQAILSTLEGISLRVSTLPWPEPGPLRAQLTLHAPSLPPLITLRSQGEGLPAWWPPSLSERSVGAHQVPSGSIPPAWDPVWLSFSREHLTLTVAEPQSAHLELHRSADHKNERRHEVEESVLLDLSLGGSLLRGLMARSSQRFKSIPDRWVLRLREEGIQLDQRVDRGE